MCRYMTYWGYCWLRFESHRRTWQMRIWMKILCSWACAAYCQNYEPNSHALRAQTMVLRSDAMRAHSRIFNKCLFCHVHRRLSTLLALKNKKTCKYDNTSWSDKANRRNRLRRYFYIDYLMWGCGFYHIIWCKCQKYKLRLCSHK